MNNEILTDREAALRRLLISVADDSPAARPVRRARFATIAIVAFALAGATTAGAVSAVTLGAREEPSVVAPPGDNQVQGAIFPGLDMYQQQAIVSATYTVIGEDTTTIDLGYIPGYAKSLVVRIECLDFGSHAVSLNGTLVTSIDCRESVDVSSGAVVPGRLGGEHSITIESTDPGVYKVWLAWTAQTVHEFAG